MCVSVLGDGIGRNDEVGDGATAAAWGGGGGFCLWRPRGFHVLSRWNLHPEIYIGVLFRHLLLHPIPPLEAFHCHLHGFGHYSTFGPEAID